MGRSPTRPIEIILTIPTGTYPGKCKRAIFTNERRSGDANIAITLSRRGVIVLIAQEFDRTAPWRNAMYKRRSGCGREGGTKKNPNHFQAYDPVCTIRFGTNVAPIFMRVPGSSEVDRHLVIYHPARFGDDVGMRRKPLPLGDSGN